MPSKTFVQGVSCTTAKILGQEVITGISCTTGQTPVATFVNAVQLVGQRISFRVLGDAVSASSIQIVGDEGKVGAGAGAGGGSSSRV